MHGFSFGYQRLPLLGGFANGAFQAALGVSIMVQSLERFVEVRAVEDAAWMVIVGGIGVLVNIVSAFVLHGWRGEGCTFKKKELEMEVESRESEKGSIGSHDGHRHEVGGEKEKRESKARDLGMIAAIVHVFGDAVNNVGVVAAGLMIWLGRWQGRYYADPGVGMAIGVMILASSVPLGKLK